MVLERRRSPTSLSWFGPQFPEGRLVFFMSSEGEKIVCACCVCCFYEEGPARRAAAHPQRGKDKKTPRTFFWQQVFIPAKCVFIPALSNMKIAIVHVGTIHRNVRIANWANAIFISVRNFHVTTPLHPFYVLLRNQSAMHPIETACFTVELITPDKDKRPRRNYTLYWFHVTMTSNSLLPRQPQLSVEDKGEGQKPGVFMNPQVFPNFSTLVVFLMNVDSINSYSRKCNQRSARFLSTGKLSASF